MLYCVFFFSPPLYLKIHLDPPFSKYPRTVKVTRSISVTSSVAQPPGTNGEFCMTSCLLYRNRRDHPWPNRITTFASLAPSFLCHFPSCWQFPTTWVQQHYVPTSCMAVDDGPLRNVIGWDDWLHRACPPNILDIAIRVLVAWANCEYPLRFWWSGPGLHAL